MINFIYTFWPVRARRQDFIPIYRPSTESVRRYEEENRNRARLAGHQLTNHSRKNHYER